MLVTVFAQGIIRLASVGIWIIFRSKPTKVRAAVHHPTLPHAEIADFMFDLSKRTGIATCALGFTILTAARSGETRGMSWGEIDLENRLWTIPAELMTASKEHRVPLSDAAIALLGSRGDDADLFSESETKPGKPISDMSMTAVLRRMNRDGITVHSFRSTFRDWTGETMGFLREVIEAALAHAIKNKVDTAYARSDVFDKRRDLIAAWATATTAVELRSNVVSILEKYRVSSE